MTTWPTRQRMATSGWWTSTAQTPPGSHAGRLSTVGPSGCLEASHERVHDESFVYPIHTVSAFSWALSDTLGVAGFEAVVVFRVMLDVPASPDP